MMNKYAAEQIKLAHLSGTAAALSRLGFPPQTTYSVLMEKGASSDEAEMLTKEALGWLTKGLGWIGKKLPALAKMLRGGARQGVNPGFAQRALTGGGKAFETAARGMKRDPKETLWRGLQNYGQGLIGGGHGVGGGLGRGTTVGLAAHGLFGGDDEVPPPATTNIVMQPPYGGQ